LGLADGRARASGVRHGPGAAGGTHGGLERDQRAPEPGRRNPAALRRHPPRSLLLRLAARAGRCAEGPLRPPAPGAVPHPPSASGAMSGLVVEGVSVQRGGRRVLDRVSLGRAGGRAGELAGGERRRVALFAALATGRPVLVLDVPLGVFDPLQLEDVLVVLRARARAGTALLLSVHQMSDAEKIASRVLVLDA